MPTALLTAGLASQPHQGVGARFVRGLGGAVRTIVSGGITLAGSLRRQAAPTPAPNPQAGRDLEASVPPEAPRSPCDPSSAVPVPRSLAAAFIAHSLRRRRPVRFGRRASIRRDNRPFTPEENPGLSPEACAFFSTPFEEGDPAMAALMFSTLEQYITEVMAGGPAIRDTDALLATIWARMGTLAGEARPDVAPAEAPHTVTDAPRIPPTGAAPEAPTDPAPETPTDPAPETPTNPAPEAPAGPAPATPTVATSSAPTDAVPDPLLEPAAPLPEAVSTALATESPDTSPVSPPAPREAPAASPPRGGAICDIVPSEATPDGRTSSHGCRSPAGRRSDRLYACFPEIASLGCSPGTASPGQEPAPPKQIGLTIPDAEIVSDGRKILRVTRGHGNPLFTPAEAAVLTGLTVKVVNNAIDNRFVAVATDWRSGQPIRRLHLQSLLCLALVRRLVDRFAPELRRIVFDALVAAPRGTVSLKVGSLTIDLREPRRELAASLRRWRRARAMVTNDPAIMGGDPVIRGTRVPVHLIATLREQGASEEEVLAEHPHLTVEQVQLAQVYAAAYKLRGRSRSRQCHARPPVGTTRGRPAAR